MPSESRSLVVSLLLIIVCGVLGALLAHFIVAAIGWQGTAATLLTVVLAMAFAFGLFALTIAAWNAFHSK